jgi:hypothetical protein
MAVRPRGISSIAPALGELGVRPQIADEYKRRVRDILAMCTEEVGHREEVLAWVRKYAGVPFNDALTPKGFRTVRTAGVGVFIHHRDHPEELFQISRTMSQRPNIPSPEIFCELPMNLHLYSGRDDRNALRKNMAESPSTLAELAASLRYLTEAIGIVRREQQRLAQIVPAPDVARFYESARKSA